MNNSVNNLIPAKPNYQQHGSKVLEKRNNMGFQNVLKDTINKAKTPEHNKKLDDFNKKNLENKSNVDKKEEQTFADDIGSVTLKDVADEEIMKMQSSNLTLGAQENSTLNLGLIGLVAQGSQVVQAGNLQQTMQITQVSNLIVGVNTESNKANDNVLNAQQAQTASKITVVPNQTSSLNDAKPIGTLEFNLQGLKQSESSEAVQLAKQENKTLEKIETADTKLPSELGITLKTENLDLSKVNIKVADSANLNKPTLPNQIAEKIIYNANNGKQEFDIQLYPKELGKIGIKLVFEGNVAQIIVSCSNPKTQSLMAIHAEGLKGILEANTGLQTTVSVQEESGMMSQHHRESFDGRGESQSRYQQENSKYQSMKDEESISFLNQLKFGLLEQNELL